MAPKPMQARAEETKRAILAAAVELFDEIGYAKTGLNDIVERSGLTKGSFYYHFDSRETIAAAIIAETDRRIAAANADASGPPTLEQLIRFTFDVQCLVMSDRFVHVGRLLAHANNQVSSRGPEAGLSAMASFVESARPVLDALGPHPGLESAEIAEVLWLGITGHNLMSAAARDEQDLGFRRLAQVWRVMMPALVPPDRVVHYQNVVERTADDYDVRAG